MKIVKNLNSKFLKRKENKRKKGDSTVCMFKAALGGGTATMVKNKS